MSPPPEPIPSLRERIEVALSLAAAMLELDAASMGDDAASRNCRGAARILRENYELLSAAPELKAALAPFAAAWAKQVPHFVDVFDILTPGDFKRAIAAIAVAEGAREEDQS